MADTIEDIAVPKGVWTDLYAGSGIAVGTAVTLVNTGSSAVRIAISASTPSSTTIGIPLFVGAIGNIAQVSAAEVGLWAYAPDGKTTINVQV